MNLYFDSGYGAIPVEFLGYSSSWFLEKKVIIKITSDKFKQFGYSLGETMYVFPFTLLIKCKTNGTGWKTATIPAKCENNIIDVELIKTAYKTFNTMQGV